MVLIWMARVGRFSRSSGPRFVGMRSSPLIRRLRVVDEWIQSVSLLVPTKVATGSLSTRSTRAATVSATGIRPSNTAFTRAKSSSPSGREITTVATPFPITFTRARASLMKQSMPRISAMPATGMVGTTDSAMKKAPVTPLAALSRRHPVGRTQRHAANGRGFASADRSPDRAPGDGPNRSEDARRRRPGDHRSSDR